MCISDNNAQLSINDTLYTVLALYFATMNLMAHMFAFLEYLYTVVEIT